MQKYTSTSNQFAYGIGYRNSKIQDSHRHLLWVSFGYKSFSLAWNRNPKLPNLTTPNAPVKAASVSESSLEPDVRQGGLK